MQSLYPYALIVHMFCAIIFIGYLFFDVVIFSKAKKQLPNDVAQRISMAIGSVAVKIMPFCVLLLVLSGGMMVSNFIGKGSYFDTNLQKILILKVALALVIVFLVVTTLTFKFILKKPAPFGNIHTIVLAICLVIAFCAKFMYAV